MKLLFWHRFIEWIMMEIWCSMMLLLCSRIMIFFLRRIWQMFPIRISRIPMIPPFSLYKNIVMNRRDCVISHVSRDKILFSLRNKSGWTLHHHLLHFLIYIHRYLYHFWIRKCMSMKMGISYSQHLLRVEENDLKQWHEFFRCIISKKIKYSDLLFRMRNMNSGLIIGLHFMVLMVSMILVTEKIVGAKNSEYRAILQQAVMDVWILLMKR